MLATPYVLAILASALALGAAYVWVRSTARERRRERRILEQLAAHMRVVEEHSANGVLLIDGNGSIEKANASAYRMFGYPGGELTGKNVFRLVQDIPACGPADTIVDAARKDGSLFQLGCRAVDVPQSSGAGKYLFFSTQCPEKTAVPDPQPATLAVAERVVNRIVQQLESLLTTINGYTELALHEAGENSPICKNLEEIATASDAASTLARHLLAFGGNQPIPLEWVDVNALLEGLQPKFDAVQVEVSAKDLYVLANRQCLQQIVSIFCGSASHRAGPEAVKQIVASRRRQGASEYAAISISDGGPALPQATLDCLFEPLFLDQEGLGVELSAVYGMVKNLGGAINVASDSARGTTFEILIPLADNPRGKKIHASD